MKIIKYTLLPASFTVLKNGEIKKLVLLMSAFEKYARMFSSHILEYF